jgi:5,6-dimethylbenzimidazole synthase
MVLPPREQDLSFEAFPEQARAWIYELIAQRRDVRHFDPARDVGPDALRRVLGAAHCAPSVGLSQPWRFIIVRDLARRVRIRENFLAWHAREAERFSGPRREQYLALKLEGITEAALNICVAVDVRAGDEAILGTTAQPEALRASAVCAVQNLWLAARAEGLGVGWVSILEPAVLRKEFALPEGVDPVAYLCIGYPSRVYRGPMLEQEGWKLRVALDAVVYEEKWHTEGPTGLLDAQVSPPPGAPESTPI